MATWTQLADTLGTDPDLSHLDAAQVEGVIDLLTLVMYADEKVTMLERSEFEGQLESLPWIANKGDLVHVATERATEAAKEVGDEKSFQAIARPAAARLPTDGVREKVFEMAVTLAHADLHLHPREVQALKWLADALGLDAEKAQATIEAG